MHGGAPHRDARTEARIDATGRSRIACVRRAFAVAAKRASLRRRYAAGVWPISKFDMISSARTSAE
ncbi:hypothetical protein WI71_20075 [Burkholderia diffusa]|nr:hypothetical protein WI71_20075 [Burkholderia diffusa]KVN06464.1 hypothetical protein WJ62_06680 [Burkholderia diffusa]